MNLIETVTTGFSELKAMLSSKVSLETELNAARMELAESKAALALCETARDTTAKTVSDSVAAVTAKDAELAALQASVTAKDAEIAALKAESKSLGERAIALVAGQGIAAKEMPASISGAAGTSRDEIMAEFARITDPKARATFYATHRTILLG